MFIQKPISITGKRSVPRPLGLATHCTLSDSSLDSSIILMTGGSRRCRKIHAEDYISDVVVEDRRWLASCNPSATLVGMIRVIRPNLGGAEGLPRSGV
jgi:hypothetical protein